MEVVRFRVKGVTLSLRCHKIKHITNWFNFINAVRRTKNKLKNTVILSAYGKIKGKKYLTRRPDEKARGALLLHNIFCSVVGG